MVEQRGMLNHLWAKVADLGLTAESAVVQNASQCFDISVWQHLAALAVGGRICIAGEETAQDPERLLGFVRREEVTVLEVVPSMLRSLLEAAADDLPRLEWLVVTGEVLPPDLCRRWLALHPRTALLNAYGPTECSDDITHHVIREAPAAAASQVPLGRPVGNFRLYVLDRSWIPVPLGAAGELCAGGEGVGRGYLGAPVRTAQAFVPDPFGAVPGARLYRTGDLARHTPDGTLEFLGRIDQQVKVRGFRIELGEIEACLAGHPEVRQSLVLVREDTPGDARLTAYLVPAAGRRLSPGELRAFLRERLTEYMVPSSLVFLEKMPLLPNGKVDRRGLPKPEAAPSTRAQTPRTEVGRAVAAVWREVLGAAAVGLEDNFFDLGGHSLLMVRVQAGLRRSGLEVSLTELFQYPTVKALATHLGAEEAPAAGPLASRQPGTPVKPVEPETAIAVIAMAGRFPGARDVEELWRNLSDGGESITF